jgi:spermidine synthase
MRRSLLFALFTVSGFAGLVYESIWSHYLKLFMGHAAYAQTLVLALFMGGMAIGAAIVSRASARRHNLLRGYAVVEAIIGLAALSFHAVFVATTEAAHASWLPALGNDMLATIVKWLLSAALILPQAILLGMTFPLMSGGLLRRHPERPGEALALLYFTNSLGAAAGILVSGFVLIERVGLPGAMQIAGIINLALAAIVWIIAPGRDPVPLPIVDQPDRRHLDAPEGLLLVIAALTGTASFIYEIVWIRMLALVLGASTHSFELMLSSFILGLALGGLWIRKRIDRLQRPLAFLAGVQVVMGLAALATIPLYSGMFDVMQTLVRGMAKSESGYALFLLGSHGIALAIMLPATFCAGMTLPLITYLLLRAGRGEQAIGRVYAANTLGSIVGVWLAAHLLLPGLGVKGALAVGAALDVALGVALLFRFADASPRWRAPAPLAASLVCIGAFTAILGGTVLDPIRMASGVYRRGDLYTARDAGLVYYKDGKTTSVALLQFGEGLSLRTNGKSDGAINLDDTGERISDEATMVLTAALPLAVKPDAKHAAVIGIGTGLTTHTLLANTRLERVDTIEIEPAMAEAARRFAPRNANAYVDPRSNLVFEDAKTYFSTHNRRYDIIISEPSNPWVSGVASLFTTEFYRHVKRYLQPGGILVQWFQLYEIDASLVASVLTALGNEFPDYAIYAATDTDLLIVAGDAATLERPLADLFATMPGVATELRRVHVTTPGDIELRRLGGKQVLAPLFAGYGVPANSDYHPYLDMNAARHRFMQSSARELTRLGNESIPVVALLERRNAGPRAPSLDGDAFPRTHRDNAPRGLRPRVPDRRRPARATRDSGRLAERPRALAHARDRMPRPRALRHLGELDLPDRAHCECRPRSGRGDRRVAPLPGSALLQPARAARSCMDRSACSDRPARYRRDPDACDATADRGQADHAESAAVPAHRRAERDHCPWRPGHRGRALERAHRSRNALGARSQPASAARATRRGRAYEIGQARRAVGSRGTHLRSRPCHTPPVRPSAPISHKPSNEPGIALPAQVRGGPQPSDWRSSPRRVTPCTARSAGTARPPCPPIPCTARTRPLARCPTRSSTSCIGCVPTRVASPRHGWIRCSLPASPTPTTSRSSAWWRRSPGSTPSTMRSGAHLRRCQRRAPASRHVAARNMHASRSRSCRPSPPGT